MFPFRSELRWKTSFEVRRYFVRQFGAIYFVLSSGLLRTKFEATSYEVRGYFVRSSGLLRTKFEATSYDVRGYCVRSSALLRTNFVSTSNELRLNFERT